MVKQTTLCYIQNDNHVKQNHSKYIIIVLTVLSWLQTCKLCFIQIEYYYYYFFLRWASKMYFCDYTYTSMLDTVFQFDFASNIDLLEILYLITFVTFCIQKS